MKFTWVFWVHSGTFCSIVYSVFNFTKFHSFATFYAYLYSKSKIMYNIVWSISGRMCQRSSNCIAQVNLRMLLKKSRNTNFYSKLFLPSKLFLEHILADPVRSTPHKIITNFMINNQRGRNLWKFSK